MVIIVFTAFGSTGQTNFFAQQAHCLRPGAAQANQLRCGITNSSTFHI
jgi:hypothetical protein